MLRIIMVEQEHSDITCNTKTQDNTVSILDAIQEIFRSSSTIAGMKDVLRGNRNIIRR